MTKVSIYEPDYYKNESLYGSDLYMHGYYDNKPEMVEKLAAANYIYTVAHKSILVSGIQDSDSYEASISFKSNDENSEIIQSLLTQYPDIPNIIKEVKDYQIYSNKRKGIHINSDIMSYSELVGFLCEFRLEQLKEKNNPSM